MISTMVSQARAFSNSSGANGTTAGDFISSNPDLSLFSQALQNFGLLDELSDPTQNFTVFAPTNAALGASLNDTANGVGKNNQTIHSFLLFSVVKGLVYYNNLTNLQNLQPLNAAYSVTVRCNATGKYVAVIDGGEVFTDQGAAALSPNASSYYFGPEGVG